MATDPRFFQHGVLLNDNRTPFHTLKTTADATTNGVEVLAAAAAGKSHYLTGMVLYNDDAAAIKIMPVHTAAAAGKTQIGAYVTVAAATTVVIRFDVPLAVGTAKNAGIVASAAGALEVEFLGYTVDV